MSQPEDGWEFYKHPGSGWFDEFLRRFPEFDDGYFRDFVIAANRADRDSGELSDIALFEVLRLASEYTERRWRFQNVHGRFLTAQEAIQAGLLTAQGLRKE